MTSIKRLFGIVILLMCSSLFARPIDEYREAVVVIKKATGLEGSDALSPIIDAFAALSIPERDQRTIQAYLFDEHLIQKWGVQISEFEDLASLLFSFVEQEKQKKAKPEFEQALGQIERFRASINQLIRQYYPLPDEGLERLQAMATGDGVVIGVFDLFEENVLKKQRQHYRCAHILPNNTVGEPVASSHGNIVIDMILMIAPCATIKPISSDAQHYHEAIHRINSDESIHIVNMSRAFAELNHHLDPKFNQSLKALLQSKIVTKSLGNTGTTLQGALTPVRLDKNLPPVGNPFSYDLALIEEFLGQNPALETLLFAINLNMLKSNVSLTATIPGENQRAIENSLSVIADGVYSYATDNYESGSSFAAPQLAGVAALLWQLDTEAPKQIKASLIASRIKAMACPLGHLTLKEQGLGALCFNALNQER